MSRTLRRRLLDVAPTVLLLVLGAGELVISDSGYRGSDLVNTLFLIATAISLLFRRRYPVHVLTFVFASQAIWVTAYYRGHQPPFEPFLAGVIVCFALGMHGGRRQLRVGLAVFALTVAGAAVSLATGGTRVADALPTIVWWLGAIGVGRLLHDREALVALLGDRAARLERERERDMAQAAMEERNRIARELHDVIAHSVSLIVVQASAERRLLDSQQRRTADVLETIEDAGRESLGELRRLLGVLRARSEPNELMPQPGLAALPDLVDESRRAGQEIDVDQTGEPVHLPAGLDLAAYRIVQEALTNARKHAPGAATAVNLSWQPDRLEIEVVNANGGTPISGNGTGHGLIGMRERATLYGGHMDAGRTSDGFQVRAVLPIEQAAA
ncbi:MAG TPA: sensor histidine kinase [Thermoleophilaceae bacterium]|jgi:signal transduction histidine kinase|nr:sensor histidine kinase [Thermoleophilaceae bacterium]